MNLDGGEEYARQTIDCNDQRVCSGSEEKNITFNLRTRA
jgi:hypothetical protein